MNTPGFVAISALCFSLGLSGPAISQPRAKSEVVIVANGDDVFLSQQEVRNLFILGNRSSKYKPAALKPNHPVRTLFNSRILGLTEARIQSFWAQQRFSGRKLASPKEFASLEALLEHLANTPGAVSYLPHDTPLPEGVRVIYSSS